MWTGWDTHNRREQAATVTAGRGGGVGGWEPVSVVIVELDDAACLCTGIVCENYGF